MSTTAETAASALPWGMLGQDAEVQALARGVAAGAPAHAYLFTGPPGSGKGTLALKLAQALVCESGGPLSPQPPFPLPGGKGGASLGGSVGSTGLPNPGFASQNLSLPQGGRGLGDGEAGDNSSSASSSADHAPPSFLSPSRGEAGRGVPAAAQTAERAVFSRQPTTEAPPPSLAAQGWQGPGDRGPVAPCGVCRGCRRVAAGTHPDVSLVAPGGLCEVSDHDHHKDNSRDIKICQIRALERRLDLAPFEARWRVEIVDPADALNQQSADAFLKTLEEPPANVVLILCTAREEALPETVRSRLRRVELRPAPIAAVAVLLEERGTSPEEADVIARLSGGRVGWAISAAHDPAILEERAAALDEAARLFAGGLAERFARAAELAARWPKDRVGVARTLDLWISWWRDVLLSAGGAERGMVNTDRVDEIRAASAVLSAADAARAVQALRDVRGQLEENASPRLALEVLMLRLPERHPPGR